MTTTGPDFSTHPDYFRSRQQTAWDSFAKTPMPVRTDETWRFADVRGLKLDAFSRAAEVSDATQAELLAENPSLREAE